MYMIRDHRKRFVPGCYRLPARSLEYVVADSSSSPYADAPGRRSTRCLAAVACGCAALFVISPRRASGAAAAGAGGYLRWGLGGAAERAVRRIWVADKGRICLGGGGLPRLSVHWFFSTIFRP